MSNDIATTNGGTALTPTVIRQGANLPADVWQDARISAAISLVYDEVRDLPANQQRACVVQYFSQAQKYDLDPFNGEIYGWWDKKRGRFVTYTSRDGLIKVAARDDNLLGVTSDVVRENDTIRKVTTGLKVEVHHESDLKGGGKVIGAYCLIPRREGPDIFTYRELEHYHHLFWKDNWSKDPEAMLETRVIAFSLRKATPMVSGLYTLADLEMEQERDLDSEYAEGAIQHQTDRLRQDMERAENGGGATAEVLEEEDDQEPEEEKEVVAWAHDPDLPEGYEWRQKEGGYYHVRHTSGRELNPDTGLRRDDALTLAREDADEALEREAERAQEDATLGDEEPNGSADALDILGSLKDQLDVGWAEIQRVAKDVLKREGELIIPELSTEEAKQVGEELVRLHAAGQE